MLSLELNVLRCESTWLHGHLQKLRWQLLHTLASVFVDPAITFTGLGVALADIYTINALTKVYDVGIEDIMNNVAKTHDRFNTYASSYHVRCD